MTHRDFIQTCEREGIVINRLPISFKGFYIRINGTPIIHISSKLKGEARLRVEFHELGHYFLHGSGRKWRARLKMAAQERDALEEWQEVEADACAAIALKPGTEFRKLMRRLSNRLFKAKL